MNRIRAFRARSMPLAFVFVFAGGCLSPGRQESVQPVRAGKADVVGMARVGAGGGDFFMDRFEVSEIRKGEFFSARNHSPRTHVTAAEAETVCREQKKRLCRKDEWVNACLGVQRRRYSYANTYKAGVCNTSSNAAQLTGWQDECRTDAEVHDLIGNVMEWVSDEDGFAVMGGSFASGESADCFSGRYMADGARSEQIGFRCCL